MSGHNISIIDAITLKQLIVQASRYVQIGDKFIVSRWQNFTGQFEIEEHSAVEYYFNIE